MSTNHIPSSPCTGLSDAAPSSPMSAMMSLHELMSKYVYTVCKEMSRLGGRCCRALAFPPCFHLISFLLFSHPPFYHFFGGVCETSFRRPSRCASSFVPEQEVPARIRAEVLTWKKEPAGVHTVCAEAGAREAFEAFNDEVYWKMLKSDKTGDETSVLPVKAPRDPWNGRDIRCPSQGSARPMQRTRRPFSQLMPSGGARRPAEP